MKVLILSPRLPSPALPMGGNTESEFARYAEALGVSCTMLVPVPRRLRSVAHIPRHETSGGQPMLHPRYLDVPQTRRMNRYTYLPWLWSFQRAVVPEVDRFVKLGGTIIHAHSATLAGAAAVAFKKQYQVNVIVTFHDNEIQALSAQSRYYQRIITRTIRGADHVVYVSTLQRDIATAHCGSHVSSVIPYGVRRYEGPRRLPPEPTLCCVCRLIPTKGVDLLITAIAQLRHRGLCVRLNIVGWGPERTMLEKLATKLGVTDLVTFKGYSSNEGALEEMASAHAMVLPSYQEAVGLVYLEAMGVGTPIIGVRGQGISQYVQHAHNGLLVKPMNVPALADCIETLVLDRALQERLSVEGKRTFEHEGFDWAGHVRKHLPIYNGLTNT